MLCVKRLRHGHGGTHKKGDRGSEAGKFSAKEKNGEDGKKEYSTLNERERARTRKAELSTLNEIVSSYQALISISPKAKVLVIFHMAERQAADQQQHQIDAQMQSPQPPREDMVACVIALEAALLPCLPARELQAIDRSPHPSHQIDVERHARDFMEAAKKLQLYFIGLQREDQPTKAEQLRKEIDAMEEELRIKTELIKKHERLIQGWKKDLKNQLDKHNTELERV